MKGGACAAAELHVACLLTTNAMRFRRVDGLPNRPNAKMFELKWLP